MEDTKSKGQLLFEKLNYTYKDAWEKTDDGYKSKAFEFCGHYKDFLNRAKTEREYIYELEELARAKGFLPLDEVIASGKKILPGMKVFQINRSKSAILSVIGTRPVREGVNIIGAHIDSPRIDLKQNPLYEDTGMVLLKTHYYGGIKKYQWLTIPLSIHGVIVKTNGDVVRISLGESEDDMVFTITDLLPHLAHDQMQKKAGEFVSGESLNVLFGSIPYQDEKVKDKVKLNILNILNEKYNITEEDFTSAELEIVPAFKARDVGIDRSMVGAYGQDDRVCAYTALRAILETDNVERTAVCVLTDKEEIGSVGNTGAQSSFMENHLAMLCAYNTENYTDIVLRQCLTASKMLSADVNAAVDPNYENVQDKKNATFMGKGIVLQKYTGSRGKVGASDANPEFIGELRKMFNDNNIIWQTGELGKVDLGGGGTVALYAANLGMDVVDCGISVLSMHAPYEVTSKIDIYTIYNAYKVFLINAR